MFIILFPAVPMHQQINGAFGHSKQGTTGHGLVSVLRTKLQSRQDRRQKAGDRGSRGNLIQLTQQITNDIGKRKKCPLWFTFRNRIGPNASICHGPGQSAKFSLNWTMSDQKLNYCDIQMVCNKKNPSIPNLRFTDHKSCFVSITTTFFAYISLKLVKRDLLSL